MNLKRVVVTGLGALTPIGNNISEYWNSLLAGVSGAGPITRFDASKLKTHFACEVKGFQPADHFDRKEARKYDLYSQFAIVAAREAIKDANLALVSVSLIPASIITYKYNNFFDLVTTSKITVSAQRLKC